MEALLNLQALTPHQQNVASLADLDGIGVQPLSVHISYRMELKYVTAIANVARLAGSFSICGLALERRR